MNTETYIAPTAAPSPQNSVSASHQPNQVPETATQKVVLSPGEWIRAVSNFEAPFGFDRMPTVWG